MTESDLATRVQAEQFPGPADEILYAGTRRRRRGLSGLRQGSGVPRRAVPLAAPDREPHLLETVRPGVFAAGRGRGRARCCAARATGADAGRLARRRPRPGVPAQPPRPVHRRPPRQLRGHGRLRSEPPEGAAAPSRACRRRRSTPRPRGGSRPSRRAGRPSRPAGRRSPRRRRRRQSRLHRTLSSFSLARSLAQRSIVTGPRGRAQHSSA